MAVGGIAGKAWPMAFGWSDQKMCSVLFPVIICGLVGSCVFGLWANGTYKDSWRAIVAAIFAAAEMAGMGAALAFTPFWQ